MNAFRQALLVLVSLGSHAGFVISERFKSGVRAALIQPLPILNRARPEFSVGDGELSAVQLRLASIDPHPVLQVGQVRRRRLPLIYCAAQGMQERCRTGSRSACWASSHAAPVPSSPGSVRPGQPPGVEKFAKPPGVSLIDAPPPRQGAWPCTAPAAGTPGCGSADPHHAGPAARAAVLHPRSHSIPAAPHTEDPEADHPVTPNAAGAGLRLERRGCGTAVTMSSCSCRRGLTSREDKRS